MKLVLATHNKGKVKEFQELLSDMDIEVVSLEQFAWLPEVIEDGNTFYENAIKKAREVAGLIKEITLADDSGLEVDFLNSAPGVYSARFAGPGSNDEANNNKLLKLMGNVPWERRTARFRCVVAVVIPERDTFTVEGVCEGMIGKEPRGANGFGYDPLFFVPEYGKTFAELDTPVKNKISHRARALEKVKLILKDLVAG